MAMGVAFILSALFVKYRDIGPVWEVVLQAGMYAAQLSTQSLIFFKEIKSLLQRL